MSVILTIIAFIGSTFFSSKPKPYLPIEVNFSPNGGVMEAVVREINISKKTILISAYSFTNQNVGKALLDAHSRGVKIEIILDPENLGNPNSLMHSLYENGLIIYLDKSHSIAHNKIMVIDSNTVISGSANFTKAASESNAENSLIIKDNQLATRYILNWELHKSHSQLYNNKE